MARTAETVAAVEHAAARQVWIDEVSAEDPGDRADPGRYGCAMGWGAGVSPNWRRNAAMQMWELGRDDPVYGWTQIGYVTDELLRDAEYYGEGAKNCIRARWSPRYPLPDEAFAPH